MVWTFRHVLQKRIEHFFKTIIWFFNINDVLQRISVNLIQYIFAIIYFGSILCFFQFGVVATALFLPRCPIFIIRIDIKSIFFLIKLFLNLLPRLTTTIYISFLENSEVTPLLIASLNLVNKKVKISRQRLSTSLWMNITAFFRLNWIG